jgi:hypothetical protein
MTELEKAIMSMLLAGDEHPLVALREQVHRASVVNRTFSGCGFFTEFSVPSEVARVDPLNFEIGDVRLELSGVKHGAGVLLFVRDGVLSMLEGYTYGEEPWPEEVLNCRRPVPIRNTPRQRRILDVSLEHSRPRSVTTEAVDLTRDSAPHERGRPKNSI